MPENYGLMNNMATGIREGMNTYMTLKNQNRQSDMLKLAQGVQDGPNGLEYTPEKQAEIDAKRQMTQDQLDQAEQAKQGRDITSDRSKRATGLLRTISGRKDIPDLSEDEATKAHGLISTNLKTEAAKNAAEARAAAMEAALRSRSDNNEKNRSFRSDKEARATANSDSLLKQYVPRLEGAAKIGELIQSARDGRVISNQALLGQVNAEISKLETGSQSPALHAAEKTELLDKSAQMHALVDAITGNPTDAVRPEVLNAAEKLVNELSGSYMSAIDSRMDYLKGGASESQEHVFNEKHDSIKRTYGPRFGHWGDETYERPQPRGLVGQQQKTSQTEKPGLLSRAMSAIGLGGNSQPPAKDPLESMSDDELMKLYQKSQAKK
jgi:hypothetical protein